MDKSKILDTMETCETCQPNEGSVKMKYMGIKVLDDRFTVYFFCAQCGHYYSYNIQGPHQIDDLS